jgi:peroxiredoxin
LGQLQEISDELIEMGWQIIAVSPDRPEKVNEILQGKPADYTLLSDSDMKAATAFGLTWRVDDETYEVFQRYDIDLEAASGREHHLLPVPAVFLLDKKAEIVFQYVNPNYKVRVAPEVVLAAARAAR